MSNSQGTTPKSSDSLIREWLLRFGIEHDQNVEARLPAWLEAFGNIEPKILEQLFIRAYKTCRFFPKVSEILAPLQETKKLAEPMNAEAAWEEILRIRREHYSPDMPQYLARELAKLDERTRQAVRASGVFREMETVEALHVWAKQRFITSYVNWEVLEMNQFALPEGELKNLIADAASKMQLPDKSTIHAVAPKGRATPLTEEDKKACAEYSQKVREALAAPEPFRNPDGSHTERCLCHQCRRRRNA